MFGKKKEMNFREIVTKWLRENGYDGLCEPGVCGCLLDDLMPCDLPSQNCQAGYRISCPGEEECEWGGKCSFHVGPNKEEGSDGCP